MYRCGSVFTAVQNHLGTRRKRIDTGLDGVKEFLIGMNGGGADKARYWSRTVVSLNIIQGPTCWS